MLRSFYFTAILLFTLIISSKQSYAWGPEGHAIVGRLALKYVSDDVRKNVLELLGKMPVDTAANWMDIMKSNGEYDFMRSWHYFDTPKGQEYVSSNNENIVNRLILTYGELQHKQLLCEAQVRMDLYILLHLMGDLTMPLHTGYEDDLGGNKVMVQYDSLKNHNLHRFWDEDIIGLTKITDNDCIQFQPQYADLLTQSVDFVSWMQESRALLPQVYDYSGFMLTDTYLQKNKIVVQQQLMKAGLRLANLLNRIFYSPAPTLDFTAISKKYKNSIPAADAVKNNGKKVTICEKVYTVRSTDKITQISVGGKNPNAPLTVIIFARNYANFPEDLVNTFKDKNICVKGKITDFKGKAQIVVESMEDIEFL